MKSKNKHAWLPTHGTAVAPNATLSAMDARIRRVLEQALEERSELARELLKSLRDEIPPEIESAWAPVIARRAREVLDGTAPTHDLEEGLDEIEARARPPAERAGTASPFPHR